MESLMRGLFGDDFVRIQAENSKSEHASLTFILSFNAFALIFLLLFDQNPPIFLSTIQQWRFFHNKCLLHPQENSIEFRYQK